MEKATKRVTVYLQPEYHHALRVKAAETEYSVSELVNEAVQNALREDALDLEAFETRADEPSIAFEKVLQKLRKDGKL
ncbi:MAG: ribbon-helix-helix protein, CopG family [Candidatus Aminicenantes bacterium]|nr:ribbon-helix-helix protein, CopG family [Candidatus Aminicenantes bacterium]